MTHIREWVTFGVVVVSFAAGCGAKSSETVGGFLNLGETDRIALTYAPEADFGARDVLRVEIKDEKTIRRWLEALDKIPAKGRLLIKMRGDTPEHRMEFFRGERRLAALRMKSEELDAPVDEGWDFYGDSDDPFVRMVRQALER